MTSEASRVVAIVAAATLLILATAGGWFAYDRWWPHSSTETVDPEGETVGSRSLGVEIQVPAGAPENTTVRFSAGSSPAGADPLYAASAGESVSIVPSDKLPDGTKVVLDFDLEKAAQQAGLTGKVSAGNAYIAVFDETWRTWLPLQTTYDSDRHTLSATPPHFTDVKAWITKPGRLVRDGAEIAGGKARDAARWTFDTTVSIGESGVNAAIEMGKAAWDKARPDFGLRRQLSDDEKIDRLCAEGDTKRLPEKTRRVSTTNAKNLHGCVLAEKGRPTDRTLLMQNDWGFAMDLYPDSGATTPLLGPDDSVDQAIIRAITHSQGIGLIGGPGATEIGLPDDDRDTFRVIGQADWLAVVTDVIIASLAIVPSGELKASMATYHAKLGVVLERHTNSKGHVTTSITAVLDETVTELKVAKDLPGLKLAERIAATYACGFQLGRAVYDLDPKKAAAQLADCALELAPDLGEIKNAVWGNLSSLSYLKSLSEYAKLPAVINDFREHGRQEFAWVVAKAEPPNWQKLFRDELGCLPDSGQPWDEFEIETARHDLTGDGAEDLVKWSSCPTTTSSNPIWVLVYDGTSAAGSQPKLIGKLGNYDYFKSMQISLKGQAVTLFGKSLGANDPRCCPSQMLKLTYRWDGGKFVEQKREVT